MSEVATHRVGKNHHIHCGLSRSIQTDKRCEDSVISLLH